MRRPNRTVSIFTLSALDVLATATGVFVLLVVLLMPYYRKTFDANAELAATRVAASETVAEIEPLAEIARESRAAATEMEAEAERIASQAAALAARTPPPAPIPVEPTPEAKHRVVDAIDLIFVIDTTASMTPVLRQLAASMRSIVRILERMVPSVRIGVAAYKDRDTGLAPVVTLPLTATDRGLGRIVGFVEGLDAAVVGSRTLEEDLHLGLDSAMAMRLRPDARQALIVIGDAAAHEYEQSQTLFRVGRFVRHSELRSVSTLFVSTPSSRRARDRGRPFFEQLAEVGGGSFNDHTGSMIEAVLLSVLVDERAARRP